MSVCCKSFITRPLYRKKTDLSRVYAEFSDSENQKFSVLENEAPYLSVRVEGSPLTKKMFFVMIEDMTKVCLGMSCPVVSYSSF